MGLEKNHNVEKQSVQSKLGAFVHSARNDLNVISMGIQSIEDLAGHPDKIQEITELIRNGGLRPLREKLDLIQKNADEESESNSPG